MESGFILNVSNFMSSGCFMTSLKSSILICAPNRIMSTSMGCSENQPKQWIKSFVLLVGLASIPSHFL